ncbi:hypothetical protein PENTCL1PPCAC_27105, partial [Pristionchus entomophagus]
SHLSELLSQLTSLLNSPPVEREMGIEDVCEAPEAMPVFWISKWIDFTEKYGICYELCDRSMGVFFNDSTKFVLDARRNQLAFVDKENREEHYSMDNTPYSLDKKVKLLDYFTKYMDTHLLSAGAKKASNAGDELARLPCLRFWLKTKSSNIAFHLSNGTLQINFADHVKLVLCPLMGAVSIIDPHQNLRVLKFSLIKEHGCTHELYRRLKYAKGICEKIMEHYSSK